MDNSSAKSQHNSFFELSALTNGAVSPLWGLEEINYSSLFQGEDFVVPQTCQDTDLVLSNEHQHQHPHDGKTELPTLPDSNVVDYFSGFGLDGLLGFGYQPMDVLVNGGYPNSVLNCSPPAYHVSNSVLGSWGNRSGQKMSTHASVVGESLTTRVGRYTAEERRERIDRYLKKRNQRNFNKTIKYVCRKTLADRRARVRGRFAKNGEDDDSTRSSPASNEAIAISPCAYYEYANHGIQKKEEGEEWLHEAIASLMVYNMAPPCPSYHHLSQCHHL